MDEPLTKTPRVAVIRPCTSEDAEWISAHLSADDTTELWTVSARDPMTAVRDAFALSTECFAVTRVAAEHPSAMFGVLPDSDKPGYGVAYIVSTDDITDLSPSLLREAGGWLDYLARNYANGLHTIIDARNTLHVRWAELAGFVAARAFDFNGFPYTYAIRSRRSNETCVTR